MFVLITYDIENDKLRTRIAKTLEAYGERVQYSVFECHLTPSQYKMLKTRLASTISNVPKEETCGIRFYRLCKSCVRRIEFLGEGSVTKDETYYIV